MAYDVIVIGAGAAGEAAATLGAELGGRVAVVERDLVGGECSFWACMPSKALLDAARHRAAGADYPWGRASARRDWIISREGIPYPDDSGHVRRLEEAGARVVRGTARIVSPGRVEVRPIGSGQGVRPEVLEGAAVIVAVGSEPVVPPIEGLREAGYWTSREATSVRDLPASVVVLGGGPVGVEMAQVYVRFGVSTTIVQKEERLLARDHPRSSEAVMDQLRREGVRLRLGVEAVAVRPGGPGRVVELSDGSTAEGSEVIVAIGRRPVSLAAVGAEEAGVALDDRGGARPDDRLAVGPGVFVAGDAAGGMQFTHLADYEGRVAVRAALGQEVRADLSAVPRTTFTEPETGAVGLSVEEARDRGVDAFEATQDFSVTARGYTIEGPEPRLGAPGHLTVVVDRERGLLVGAFAACPGASELIHEAVVAIRHRIPVAALADTIHAFPTGARVFGNLVAEVARRLGAREGCQPVR